MPTSARAVVLMPTFNEVENIGAIVPAVLAAAPVDLMILDDASPDGTGAAADILARDEPRLSVVHRSGKAGLGAAYIDGFRRALAAGYELVLEMDADFSHPPSCLPQMLLLAQQHDLVLGSRWVPGGGTRHWSRRREAISRLGSLYARWALGVAVRDLTTGFKCFRRRVLAALDLQATAAAGYAFQIEMTYRALRMGFDVAEMPFVFVERGSGTSKMSHRIVLEALIRVPQLRRRYRQQPPARSPRC